MEDIEPTQRLNPDVTSHLQNAEEIQNSAVSNMKPENTNGTRNSPEPALGSELKTTEPTKPQRGEKQIKPNKVYIGGLPEHTRQEDLQNCFGKLGTIAAIELKLGYGFVEFDTREAAEESVAKYHEGYFMGNKIRVELSHGGGRTAKYSGEPGACFKCGNQGHWARECPNSNSPHRRPYERDDRGPPPHLSKDIPPGARDDHHSRYYAQGSRDGRYSPEYPPPLSREYRGYRSPRSLTPTREYRDYPRPREINDYRVRGPPPPAMAPVRYDTRVPYYPPSEVGNYRETGYSSRGPYAPASHLPPARDPYDRRGPPGDRYAYSDSPSGARPRSPLSVSSRPLRDEYERIPPREYAAPAPADYRARSPRYVDDRRSYRRRSQSPMPVSRVAGPSYVESGVGYQAAPPVYGGPPRSAREDYRPSDRNGRA